jgi:WD40 repeat protein
MVDCSQVVVAIKWVSIFLFLSTYSRSPWLIPSDLAILWFLLLLQTARIWEYSSGEIKQDLRGHDHVVEAVVFAPLAAYPALRELAGMPSNAKEEKSTHGLFVATGSRDKTVKIWDTVSGQCIKTLSGHEWVSSSFQIFAFRVSSKSKHDLILLSHFSSPSQ